MREIAKKVQMIRLQEECCKLQVEAEQYCAKRCKIERECIELEKNIAEKQTQKL